MTLDLRYGKSRALAPITDEVAVQVFEAALAHAAKQRENNAVPAERAA